MIVARTGCLFGQILFDFSKNNIINDATGEKDKTVKNADYVIPDYTKYDCYQQLHMFFYTIDEYSSYNEMFLLV